MSSHWPTLPLSALIEPGDKINYGVVQPGTDVADGIPLIRVADLVDGNMNRESFKRIATDIEAQYARSRLRGDEILLACVGSIGTVALAHEGLAGCNIARAVARIRCGPKLVRRFLARYLQSTAPQQYFAKETRTVAQPTLNIGQIESLPIPLPPLTEQRRIADILDKADAIRRKRKEAITLTEDLLRSAFLEMFGDPVTNPKGWAVKPLGDIADIASGVTKGKNYGTQRTIDVPYMRVANVQDGHLVLDDVKSINVSETDVHRYLLEVGDVLLTEGGDPDKLGRGAVWRGEIANCIHQNHIFRVRGSKLVLPEYLSALIGSERGKRYFLQAAKQTTGIATINMTQLKGFSVLLPPLALQHSYVDLIARTSSMRERQHGALRNLNHLFSSLVDRAFRGELTAPSTSKKKQLDMFEGLDGE